MHTLAGDSPIEPSSSSELRNFHEQMIQRSLRHLKLKTNEQHVNQRLISGITLAGNPKNLARAIAHLEKALHETAEILNEGDCTEVYQLNNQLFPHTK